MRLQHFALLFLAMSVLAGLLIPGFALGLWESLMNNYWLWIKIAAVMAVIVGLYFIKPIRYTGVIGLLVLLSPLILWGLYELATLVFNEAGQWLYIIPAAIVIFFALFKYGGKIRVPKASRMWDFTVTIVLGSAMIIGAIFIKKYLDEKSFKERVNDQIYSGTPKSNEVAVVGPTKRWSGTTLPIGNVKFTTVEPYKWEHESNADVYLSPRKTGDQVVLKYYNTTRRTSWTRKVTRIGPGQWDFNTEDIEGKSIAAVGDKMLVAPQNAVDGVVSINYR